MPPANISYLHLGARNSAPFLIIVAPFGMLFGVIATEAGLDLAQVMGFSIVVIAGASQFAALQLMTDQAPALIVLASALAVNLRMAMYSASLAPHLGAAPIWQRAVVAYAMVDQIYALSITKYEADRTMTTTQRVLYYFGAALPIVPGWFLATLGGALLGQAIPTEWGLEFAVPVAFLALVAPALRTLAHVAAAATSVILAIAFAGLPWNLGLIPAALGAMAVGAEVERRMALRAAP